MQPCPKESPDIGQLNLCNAQMQFKQLDLNCFKLIVLQLLQQLDLSLDKNLISQFHRKWGFCCIAYLGNSRSFPSFGSPMHQQHCQLCMQSTSPESQMTSAEYWCLSQQNRPHSVPLCDTHLQNEKYKIRTEERRGFPGQILPPCQSQKKLSLSWTRIK